MADLITDILSLPDKVDEIESAINKLFLSIERGVTDVKQFKFNPRWKTRVISIPIAIDQVEGAFFDVVDDVKGRFQKFKDLIDLFKAQVNALKTGAAGYAGRPLSGLGRAGLDVLIASLIVSLIGDMAKTFDEIADFAGLFDSLIKKIESLDDVFLGQNNPRKTETLEDGGTIRVRIGKLHKQ